MATIDQLRAYRNNPNVQKFLNMLSAAEGTTTHGYATAFGGGRISDLSHHPKKFSKFRETTGRTNTTSAAGRYQFIGRTWDSLQRKLGLPDFGAESQDLAAIELLRENGALPHILKGDMQTAVKKAGGTWASLPSSKAPQRTRSWDFINKHLGMHAGLPSEPTQTVQAEQPEQTNSLAALASTLAELANMGKAAAQTEEKPAETSIPQEEKIDVITDKANTYAMFQTPDLSDDVQPMDFSLDNSVNIAETTSPKTDWIGDLQKSIETANYVDMQNEAIQKMFGGSESTPAFGTMPDGVMNYLNSLIGKV